MRILVSLLLLVSAADVSAQALDLTACVQQALVRNPTLQDARDSTTTARLRREVALAEYNLKIVPTVDGGLQGSNETNQRYQLLFGRKVLPTGTEVTLTGGTSVFSSVPQLAIPYFTETRLGVAQPLLQGRSRLENRDRIDDADRRVSSADHALESAREDLALEVVRGFYEVVAADELVRVGEKSIERVEQLRDVADAKLSLGQVSKMDVFRAELHAGRMRNAVLQQRARRDAGVDALKRALGIDPRVRLEIDGRLQGPRPLDLPPEAVVESALDRRIEVIEAKLRVADAERKLLLARHRLWPAVYLTGAYARQGLGDDFDSSLKLDREEWTVGLRSSVPLDRTIENVAVGEAELALRGSERQYQKTLADVIQEVRDSRRQLDRARAERALAAEVSGHAEQQAELARLRYEKGITNNFDLVQAEQQLTDARTQVVLGAIQEVMAAAFERRAAGKLLEAFGVAAARPAQNVETDDASR